MSHLSRTLGAGLLLAPLVISNNVGAAETCSPAFEPPAQPYTEEVYKCLHTIIFSINREEPGDYRTLGERLVRALLSYTGPAGPGMPPWKKIAEVVAILNSQALIDLFVEVIGAPHDGEETDAAYARLYAWRAPNVLQAISRYDGAERTGRVESLAWAIANLYWGHINRQNYRRLPIGPYWELLDSTHPLRSVAEEVERAILDLGIPDS